MSSSSASSEVGLTSMPSDPCGNYVTTCEASYNDWLPENRSFYTSVMYRCDLTEKSLNFITYHQEDGKTDDDVEAVAIIDSKAPSVPPNLHSTYKFLTILCMRKSNLTKISRDDLNKFENLKELWLPNNNLRELPGDLFEDNPSIERISFSNNKLVLIGDEILKPLKNLKSANFRKNLCINAVFEESGKGISLDELKSLLKVKKVTKRVENFNAKAVEKPKFDENVGLNILSSFKNDKILARKLFNTNDDSDFTGNSSNDSVITQDGSTSSDNLIQLGKTSTGISSAPLSDSIITQCESTLTQSIISSENSSTFFQSSMQNFLDLSKKSEKSEKSTQTSTRNFMSDLNAFLYDEQFKDFEIKGPKKRFKVHKFVMIARCPAVNNMIRENPAMKGLEIADSSDEIIESVLDFIYEDQMPDFRNFKEILMIFDLAMKLDVKKLSIFAEGKILVKISMENSIQVLEIAIKHDVHRLKVAAFEFVNKIFPDGKFKEKIVTDKKEMEKLLNELKKWQKSVSEATVRFSKMCFFEG